MAFIKKEWADRISEFPGRRRLKNALTGEETIYDVTRNEGKILKEGDAFSAENMNDLESRIGDALNELGESVADGKALIASAITSKGVGTAANASFLTMANNIKNINTAGIMSTSGRRNGNYTWYADKDYQGLVIAAYRSGSRATISRAATYFNLLVETDQKLYSGIFVVSSKINKGESITVTATESYIIGNGA